VRNCSCEARPHGESRDVQSLGAPENMPLKHFQLSQSSILGCGCDSLRDSRRLRARMGPFRVPFTNDELPGSIGPNDVPHKAAPIMSSVGIYRNGAFRRVDEGRNSPHSSATLGNGKTSHRVVSTNGLASGLVVTKRWTCGANILMTYTVDVATTRIRCPSDWKDRVRDLGIALRVAADAIGGFSYHCPCPAGDIGNGYWIGVEIDLTNVDESGKVSDPSPPLDPLPDGMVLVSRGVRRVFYDCTEPRELEGAIAITTPNGSIVVNSAWQLSPATIAHEFAHGLGLSDADHDATGWFSSHSPESEKPDPLPTSIQAAAVICKLRNRFVRSNEACCKLPRIGGTTQNYDTALGILNSDSVGGGRWSETSK